jgi:hypothetical protein
MRKEKLMRMLTVVMKYTPLDKTQILLIAEYALPCATDVRVAWKDSEGQSRDMRDGAGFLPCVGELMML